MYAVLSNSGLAARVFPAPGVRRQAGPAAQAGGRRGRRRRALQRPLLAGAPHVRALKALLGSCVLQRSSAQALLASPPHVCVFKGWISSSGLQRSFVQLWQHLSSAQCMLRMGWLSCSSAGPTFEVEGFYLHNVVRLVRQSASFMLTLCADCAEEGSFPVRAQGSSHGPPTLASSAWGDLKAGRRQDSVYGAAHVTGLEASRTLALLPGETVLQVPHDQLACPL